MTSWLMLPGKGEKPFVCFFWGGKGGQGEAVSSTVESGIWIRNSNT